MRKTLCLMLIAALLTSLCAPALAEEVWVCRNCWRQNAGPYQFCPACGTARGGGGCPTCGFQADAAFVFCPQCGGDLRPEPPTYLVDGGDGKFYFLGKSWTFTDPYEHMEDLAKSSGMTFLSNAISEHPTGERYYFVSETGPRLFPDLISDCYMSYFYVSVIGTNKWYVGCELRPMGGEFRSAAEAAAWFKRLMAAVEALKGKSYSTVGCYYQEGYDGPRYMWDGQTAEEMVDGWERHVREGCPWASVILTYGNINLSLRRLPSGKPYGECCLTLFPY